MPRDILTEAEINAPISRVWNVLADIDTWDTWTSIFNFKKAKLEPGGRGLLLARVGPGAAPLPIRFDVVDNEREIRWHGGVPGVLHGSHFLKLEKIDDKTTRLIHGEEFTGLVINASWKLIGDQLPAAYDKFNRDLISRMA
ncbi:MAG: SRPBCC domain-containing protein [Salinisphaeraceae bacterium]|nr:SRPBCC domain-containing protein [Salinisphaeraceae bacterium]